MAYPKGKERDWPDRIKKSAALRGRKKTAEHKRKIGEGVRRARKR